MNSNGAANKGGKGPTIINKESIKPPSEATRRNLFANFLRSCGANPNAIEEFKARRTMEPEGPSKRPQTLMDQIFGGSSGVGPQAKPEPVLPAGDMARPALTPESPVEEPTQEELDKALESAARAGDPHEVERLVEAGARIPEALGSAKSRRGTPDGYSTEFSIANLPKLSTLPEGAEPDFSGFQIPQGKGSPGTPYDEVLVAAEGESLDLSGEEIDLKIKSEPPEAPNGRSEVSSSLDEAIVMAAARLGRDSYEPQDSEERLSRPNGVVDPKTIRSERPTLPPPSPAKKDGNGGELPGSPPETGLAIEQRIAQKGEPTARTRERLERMSREEIAAAIPLENLALREERYVPMYVEDAKSKIPPRFHPTIDSAMEIIEEGLEGYEDLVAKFIQERRWTVKEEEALESAFVKTADHLIRLFDKKYDKESEEKIASWKDTTGELGNAERNFAFAIINSRDRRSNHETNVFDAFAKGVMFLYLIRQRPGSFIHAISHPEISKPYGQLGGPEGAGIASGLRLYPHNLEYAYHFRCYEETHIVTIAMELRDEVLATPSRSLVGKFEDMVRKDVAEFETAVSHSGLTLEKFFEVLNEGYRSDELRSNKELIALFDEARKNGLIYTKADDLFDALELINDYMVALRMNPMARDMFFKFYLANYPMQPQSGNFYKAFGMCLFDSLSDFDSRIIAKKAFETDPNPAVKDCFAKRCETLEFEERQTMIAGPGSFGSGSDDETDFGDLNG